MFRKLLFISFMMGAIGVPYLLSSSSDMWSNVKSKFQSGDKSKSTAKASQGSSNFGDSSAAGGAAQSASLPGFPGPPAKPKNIEGYPVHDLAEVLRFDGTPDWVMARWPRVSTGLAQPDLQGYRVPLVTGTGQDDLAGSLTYYFDGDQRLKFITFHGATGDPRKLVALVVGRYGFKPEESQDPSLSLFMVKWNGKPLSELRIRTARVLRADQPNTRYHVDLALARP